MRSFCFYHHFQPLCIVIIKAELFIKRYLVGNSAKLYKNISAAYTVLPDEFKQLIYKQPSDAFFLIFGLYSHVLYVVIKPHVAKKPCHGNRLVAVIDRYPEKRVLHCKGCLPTVGGVAPYRLPYLGKFIGGKFVVFYC